MTYSLLSAVVCISLVTGSAMARGEYSQSDRTSQGNVAGSSGTTAVRGSSWEGWLTHGARDVTPEPPALPRSSALGSSMSLLAPSAGSASGVPGLDAGRSPFRLESNAERERRETDLDDQRR